jgi:TolB-like protein
VKRLITFGSAIFLLVSVRAGIAQTPEIPFAGIAAKRQVSILRDQSGLLEASTVSGLFNANTMFLAEQLQKNLTVDARGVETVVSTVTDINNLESTSPLGRLISEHLAHHLNLRGWSIVESKLVKELIFTDDGEFGMTRSDFRKPVAMRARNVVTGTYAVTKDGILVTLKMIDTDSGRLVSSAQTRILRDKFSADLALSSSARAGTTVTVTR